MYLVLRDYHIDEDHYSVDALDREHVPYLVIHAFKPQASLNRKVIVDVYFCHTAMK